MDRKSGRKEQIEKERKRTGHVLLTLPLLLIFKQRVQPVLTFLYQLRESNLFFSFKFVLKPE